MRFISLLLTTAFAVVALGGCAGSRSSLEVTQAQLAEARTPAARAEVLVARLADGGLTPLAGGASPGAARVWRGGRPPLVAAWVPGLNPLYRTQLVTVATALDGVAAAETAEAARRLVAARPAGRPDRTVLVAYWPASQDAASGLATLRQLPLWPDSLRMATLVVGAPASPGAVALETAGLAGEPLVVHILEAALALAAPPVAPETLAVYPSR